MRAIGNFLWFILGGVLMGLGWWLVGLVCFVTIVGIPWGRACFVIGQFAFLPFGKVAISRKELSNQSDIGTGAMGLVAFDAKINALLSAEVVEFLTAYLRHRSCSPHRIAAHGYSNGVRCSTAVLERCSTK